MNTPAAWFNDNVRAQHRAVTTSPLIDAAEEFRSVLDTARRAIAPRHFSWYPYDSLGNAVHLTRLLEGSGFDLMQAVRGKTILDLGCADGDFALFLESLGASVVAVDHPRSNHNNLAGITALKEYLKSSIEVQRMDLEEGVRTSAGFELTLALGLLYHLKNPFLFLETLSQRTRYCLLSTRVMRRLPDSRTDISKTPIAYLLGSDELNDDNSNFWIFSHAALHRLLGRSHWKVLAWSSAGNTSASDPHTLENDERAFCFLESTWGELGLKLLSGWHQPEDSGWRWAAGRFSASADDAANARWVRVSLYVPDALISAFGQITLTATINGIGVQPETWSSPGLYQFTRQLPVRSAELELRFAVSHALPPDSADVRERSVIVESISLGT